MRVEMKPDHTVRGRTLALVVRGLAAACCAVALAACGATLNPALEHGIATSDGSAQLAAGVGGGAIEPMPINAKIPSKGLDNPGAAPALGSIEKRIAVPAAVEGFAGANTPGASSYKIGPNDVLEVSVFKVPELNRVVQVGDGGTVNLPLVNEISVAGKTPQEFERELTSKLGAKYLQSPQVTVSVREFNSQRITIEGAVKSPGVITMKGKTTLLQVMAQAGGIDTAVATSEVVVFRVRDGKRYAAKFDLSEIRTGNAADPPLVAGDVVVVNASDMKSALNNFMKALPLASFLLLL